MEFKKIHQDAQLPKRATPRSAGFDLFACSDVTLEPYSTTLVKTGIQLCKLPPGTYARIAGRSGLSLKQGLMVGAGVVDEDYRGEIGVVFHTMGNMVHLNKGDKIAQMIITGYLAPQITEIGEDDMPIVALDEVKYVRRRRSAGGFGSTGR